MNCTDCKAAVFVHPCKHARAERASIFKHLFECNQCLGNLHNWQAEAAKTGAYDGYTVADNIREHLQDEGDPEFREITSEAVSKLLQVTPNGE